MLHVLVVLFNFMLVVVLFVLHFFLVGLFHIFVILIVTLNEQILNLFLVLVT